MPRFNGLPVDTAAPKRPRFAGTLVEQPPVTSPTTPEAGIWDRTKDTGVDLAKGVVGLGESAVGLLDLGTGNMIGNGLKRIGFDPQRARQMLESGYSAERKVENEEVRAAEGFIDTVVASIQNPSVIVGTVVESSPMLLMSGGAVRAAATNMLRKRGLQAGTQAAMEFFKNPAVRARLATIGAATEGAMSAGSNQEQARQAGRDFFESAPYSIAAGVGTAAIGVLASRVPGLGDIESTVGTAGMGNKTTQSIGKRIAAGMFQEGVLEELPQSAQEQIFNNLALGNEWDEGVPEAAGTGLLAGAGMGGVVRALERRRNDDDPAETINRIAGAPTLDDAIAEADSILRTVTPGESRPVTAVETTPYQNDEDQPAEPDNRRFYSIDDPRIPTLTDRVEIPTLSDRVEVPPGAAVQRQSSPAFSTGTAANPAMRLEMQRALDEQTIAGLESLPATELPPGAETGENNGIPLENQGPVAGAQLDAPQPILKTNGTPFLSRRSAELSQQMRNNPGAQVVEVEGGFGLLPVAVEPVLVEQSGNDKNNLQRGRVSESGQTETTVLSGVSQRENARVATTELPGTGLAGEEENQLPGGIQGVSGTRPSAEERLPTVRGREVGNAPPGLRPAEDGDLAVSEMSSGSALRRPEGSGRVGRGEQGQARTEPAAQVDNPQALPSSERPTTRRVGAQPATTGMQVEFNGQRYPVSSVQDAQNKWDQFRQSALKEGGGASSVGGVKIFEGGKQIARISYNGRAWDMDGKEIGGSATTDTAPPAQPSNTPQVASSEPDIQAEFQSALKRAEAEWTRSDGGQRSMIAARAGYEKAQFGKDKKPLSRFDWADMPPAQKREIAMKIFMPKRAEPAAASPSSADFQSLVDKSNTLAQARKRAVMKFGKDRAAKLDDNLQTFWNAKVSKKRSAAATRLSPNDSLARAIAKMGGINTSWMEDLTGDTKHPFPGLFTKAGTSPDDMARNLADAGYFPEERAGRDTTHLDAEMRRMLKDELSGRKKHYQLNSPRAEQEAISREEQMYQDQAEQAEAQLEAQLDQIAAEYGQEAADLARQYHEDMRAYEAIVDTRLEAAVESQLAEERETDEESIRQAAAEADAAEDRGTRDEGAGETGRRERAPAGEPDEDFGLNTQTETSLRADAARKADIERNKKTQSQKADADDQRSSFTLTGSDRAADVAEARGQNTLFSQDEDAPIGRFRPKSRVTLSKPLAGPSGAKLIAYEWAWRPEEYIDRRGEERTARVSDWEKASSSAETGRDIVHKFAVQMPDGTEKVVSLESATDLLGFTAAQKGQFRSVASAAKTVAKNEMQLAVLRGQLEEVLDFKKQVDAMTPPAARHAEGETLNWKMGDASVRQSESGSLTDERRRVLVNSWRANRYQEITDGLHYYGKESRLRNEIQDVEARIARARKKLDEAARGQDTLFSQDEIPNQTEVGEFKTGKPVTFNFIHNTDSATRIFGKPKKDSQYGRYYEPSGRYVVEGTKTIDNPNIISGTLTFQNPLVIFNDDLNWKKSLSDHYGGKRGKALSKALIADGYDGVVTVEGARGSRAAYLSEILDLTTFDEGKALFSQDEKSLYVVHNTSAERIKHMDEIGGLAAPSLAIKNLDNGAFDNFGDISLIANPNLIEDRDARAFNADVYSTRHPQAKIILDAEKYDNFRKQLEADIADMPIFDIPSVDDIESSGARALLQSHAFQYALLKREGVPIPRYKDAEASPIVRRTAAAAITELGGKPRGWKLENSKAVESAAQEYWRAEQKKIDALDPGRDINFFEPDGTLSDRNVRDFSAKVERYIADEGLDSSRIRAAINKQFRKKSIAKKAEQEAGNLFNGMVKNRVIFKGFTNAGNRRYVPYTMQNILAEMTKTIQGGEKWNYGAGSVRSKYAYPIKTVKQAVARKGELTSKEEMDRVRDESQNKLHETLEAMRPYYRFDRKSFGYLDDASSAIGEGPRGISEAFEGDEPQRLAREFIDYVRNLPTEYFEIKMKRAMGLNEFAAAVVPRGTDQDVIDILTKNGVAIKYYKRGDKQARADAVRSVGKKQDVLFQKPIPSPLIADTSVPGMTVEEVTAAITPQMENLKQQFDLDVIVLKSPRELPDVARMIDAKKRIRGAYHEGVVYLFADNLQSARGAQVTLAHELIGHKGVLEAVTAEEWADIKSTIDRLKKMGSKTANAIWNEVERRYPNEPAETKYKEFLAVAAEKRVLQSKMQTVFAKIKATLRRILKALGFNQVFSDSDIEIILSNSERYLRESGEAMQQEGTLASEQAPAFYSAALEGARALKQEKGTPEQMVNLLLKQKDVKQEEVEHLGLREYLDGLGKTVTKQQIVDFIAANGVQVQPVTLESKKDLLPPLPEGWKVVENTEEEADSPFSLLDENGEVVGEGDTELDAIRDAVDPDELYDRFGAGTKFDKYQLPGGTNYREVLLTLPEKITDGGMTNPQEYMDAGWKAETHYYRGVHRTTYRILDSDGDPVGAGDARGNLNQEQVFQHYAEQQAAGRRRADSARNNYTSGHWDQPNVIAHVRLNDRTDADGRKVLFVEEIQSDWHQEGRKKGYQKASARTQPKLTPEQRADLGIQARNILRDNDNLGFDSTAQATSAVLEHEDWRDRWEIRSDREAAVLNEYRIVMLDERATKSLVPDAPFKNNAWAELAIKQVLRMAAEGGYDAVSWTTGEQQSDRYSLRKQVDRVTYEPDTRTLDAYKDGAIVLTKDAAPEDLPDIIGKEAAERLLATDPNAGRKNNKHELAGADLEFGGEGMKAFYDRILPNLFKKVAGRMDRSATIGATSLGGTTTSEKPTRATIGGKEEWRVWDENDNVIARFPTEGAAIAYISANMAVGSTQPSIPITDKMRESALSGQPLFSQGESDFQEDDSTGFAVPDETLVTVAIRKMQDKFKVLKDVQANIRKAGGTITDENDAYLAEELFHGKAENDLREMRDQYVEPLAEKMAKFGISRADLDRFLYARHAPERNKYIASINPKMQDGGSGMTNAESVRILREAQDSGKLDEYQQLAAIVDDIVKLQRDMIVQGGLEDDGLVSAWQDTYKYYVPLKGWAEDTKDQGKPRTGKGFNIGGKETKRALGRSSKAASPLSFAIVDLTEKIIRKRKNEVGNALLKLIQDNPNPEYWETFDQDNPEVDRKISKVNGVDRVTEGPLPMAMLKDRYFTTKVDGKTHYMRLKDERLMRAMKNLGPESNGALLRALAGVNRVLSALNTSYSPEFLISNFARDVQTAVLNLQAEQSLPPGAGKASGKAITAQTIKDIPKAMRAAYSVLRGDKASGDPEWTALFEQFRADGAKTGYFDMKDLDGQSAEIDKLVEIANGGWKGNAMKWAASSAKIVETLNGAVENAVRLSAYANAIKAGLSRPRAASLAKNMTVNFNRRGELGTTLNALYMFANASIQGTANFVRTMGTLKGDKSLKWSNLNNAQKLAVGITAAAFFLAMANRAGAGDDDDGENWYDKVPDYVKERNIVLMKSLFGGEQNGEYWKIPLPYGFNIFYVMGDNIAAVTAGAKSPLQAAGNVTLTALGSFSPIGYQDSKTVQGMLLKNAAPTVAKPVVELALNENFAGSSIFNENFPFGTPKPDSSLGRRSTPEAYTKIAAWLNEVTGGSEFRSGAIDVNPDVMQYVLDYMGGSAYSFFGSKVPDYLYRQMTGTEPEVNQIPFISRIAGRVMPYDDTDKFYTRRDEITQIYDEYRALPERERVRYPREDRQKLALRGLLRGTESQLSALRRRRDAAYAADISVKERDTRLKEVESKMKAAVDRFNSRYNAIE